CDTASTLSDFFFFWGEKPREGSTAVALPPPLAIAKAFSPSGCGRIFPLFSRVMRVRLSTGLCASRPESGLSGAIFSGPVACADLVNSIQVTDNASNFDWRS
uniref:hypothetical protein n=1 Tax=Yoonia sp. TaxID=2212373 RepID=UPI004047F1E4